MRKVRNEPGKEGRIVFPLGRKEMQTVEEERHIGEGLREGEEGQGQDFGYSRKQDPGLPANNGREGEMFRQKESYPFSVVNPLR